jgi:hypothetical protein
MTQQTSTTIPAGPLAGAGGGSIESTMTQEFRTLVEEVAADGSATLQQVIESVRVEMRLPSGTIRFDSDTPDADASTNPMTQAITIEPDPSAPPPAPGPMPLHLGASSAESEAFRPVARTRAASHHDDSDAGDDVAWCRRRHEDRGAADHRQGDARSDRAGRPLTPVIR